MIIGTYYLLAPDKLEEVMTETQQKETLFFAFAAHLPLLSFPFSG